MFSSFSSYNFQCRYRSGDCSALPRKFYNEVLPNTKLYKRAVGFFSSTSFLEISYGILSLVQNGGKMQLITSPKLNEDDIVAIKQGYENRENVYLMAFKREMLLPKTINEKNRLNILANLIEQGILEIKIAITENPEISMYHEKIGVFEDNNGNKLAISGSMNESETAISENFESFQVFCGWKNGDKERVETCENDFDAMWTNKQNALQVYNFPELPEMFVQTYKVHHKNQTDKRNLEGQVLAFEYVSEDEELKSELFFDFNNKVKPREHQRAAIQKFIEDEFKCLFAMATGTGKTLTSLFAANELSCYIHLDSILIIVPLKDLVDQWEKDVRKYFTGEIITVRSGIDWKEKISDLLLLRMLKKDKRKRLVIITTYDSFSLNDEKLISVIGENALIIADEAHKFGAVTYSKKMPENIKYRIALSATPKRAYDDNGTKKIFDYFCPSDNPYEFTIKDAIDNEMLCHYNYYPVVVCLTDDEMDSYNLISEKVSRISLVVNNSKKVNAEDKKYLEQLLKERHRIIERAEKKKDIFLEIMLEQIKKYKDKTIVFCPDGSDENGNDLLTTYRTELWSRLIQKGKIVSMAEYVQGTDKKVIESFAANAIHILFAKQRLNEGIDIPAACRAFFIASSTSEREFIQRRGRVLRKSVGKKIAEIFDFIVVPPNKDSQYAQSIINSEIKRAMDFAATADNYAEIEQTLRAWL